MRKPHNLVTGYWDDMIHFQVEAKKVEGARELYDRCYTAAVSNLPKDNDIRKIAPNLPTFDRRAIRYAILSSHLFLEAFINQEYHDEMGFNGRPNKITIIQKKNLNEILINTNFCTKWSSWVSDFSEERTGKKIKLKGEREFQELMKLKDWRNHLTHYKIHNLMLVAHEIEIIENSREAIRIVKQIIEWYFKHTQKEMSDWMKNEMEILDNLANR